MGIKHGGKYSVLNNIYISDRFVTIIEPIIAGSFRRSENKVIIYLKKY